MSDDTNLKLTLTAEDGITAVIERVVEALGDTKLGHAITAISTGFEAATHIIEKVEQAFDAVKEKVEEAIHAAAEHEVAEKKLAAALVITGNYSEQNVEHLDAMAVALAKTSGVSEVAVKDAAALGASLGIQGSRIEEATSAAINLAAVLNIDVNTAMRQVAATQSGFVDRLARAIPELKGFTAAQLEQGAAIEFLADHFKGFASTLNDTYAGAVKRAEQSQHNFIASMGEFITSSTAVRASLAAKAALYDNLTAAIKSAQVWLQNNSELIDRITNGIKSAIVIYGAYFIAINAVTIATTAATIASTAFAAAIAVATSPITLTIAGVAALSAGLAYLGVNTDHVIGIIKIMISGAIFPLTASLGALVYGVGAVVGAFNKDLGDSIKNAGTYLTNMSTSLYQNGAAQLATAEATRQATKAHNENGEAIHAGTIKVDEHEQALRRAMSSYARLSEAAKPALDSIKDFAPKLSLIDWERDRVNFQDQLKQLQSSATIVVKTIQESGGPKSGAESAIMAKAIEDQKRASEALTALKIKDFETVRDAAIKNADVWIEYEKQKAISAADEIMLKKVAAAEETRAKMIDIRTQEIIAEQELQRHYLTVEEEAQKKANDEDLNAYKAMLDTKMSIAVDAATNRAIAEDQAALSVAGSDPVAKAHAQARLTEDVETAHQERLNQALQQGLISREDYERESQASRLAQQKAANAGEIAEHQQKAELLGLTDQAVKEQQLASELEYNDNLNAIKDDQLLTDQDRQAAIEDAEMTHTANMNQIREKNLQDEAHRADQMHDYWAVTLAKIRLEQERHGVIMGTLMGIQNSAQYQATNQMLTNLASLRNSHSKKAFEVGKAAATAQAVIQAFLAANEAYAAMAVIPIVGPILGAAAAAAALAAGFVQVQNIQSQKFNAAHGGIDEVPQSLDNSTFVLKGGESVLQPDANKDLRQAAKTINEGGGSREVNINVTIYGTPSNEQVDDMKKAIIDALRDASERGTPIIHEKGVVKAS